MNVGLTAAIAAVVLGSVLVNQLGWWDAWPWWGNTLYVIGCLVVFVAGVNAADAGTWKKDYNLPETPPKDGPGA